MFKFGGLAPSESKKILAKFKFGGGTSQRITLSWTFARVYLGVLLSFRLKCLNKAGSSQIYKKYKCQNAGAELAICTAHVEGLGVGPRVLLHALHYYTLRAKIIVADFNLAVSTPTAKLPNLILHQVFQLYNNSTCVYSYLKQWPNARFCNSRLIGQCA